jgi:phosphatidylethanolamine/phosphatidyl-N-methylethanolamine N-methyltransferase
MKVAMNSQESISHRRLFFQQFRQNPFQTGAILPGSKALAQAMVAYLAQKQGQVHVLEVGAGTGAFTTRIIPLLQPGDSLDIVEINPKLMAYLRQQCQMEPRFQTDGIEVRFINDDIRNVSFQADYEYIIFSLPLTNFPSAMVQEILELMMSHLKPGGVFSYVKYIFIGRLKYLLGGPTVRAEMKASQEIINVFARQHQLERRAILRNVPPAWTYYWQKPV